MVTRTVEDHYFAWHLSIREDPHRQRVSVVVLDAEGLKLNLKIMIIARRIGYRSIFCSRKPTKSREMLQEELGVSPVPSNWNISDG